jgi:hypothetical protein
MKKLVALLAVVVLSMQSLYASDFLFMKNIKYYGEGQIIGYSVQNGYDLNIANLVKERKINSNYSGVVSFLTAGITFDFVENVSADLSLAYSNNWAEGGNKFWSLANDPNGSPIKGNSIQSYLDNIRVQTANITIKKLFDVDGLSVKVGRQYYGDEDSSVMYFGIRRYQPLFGVNLPLLGFDSITSVNAVTLYYDKENVKANLIYANLGKLLGLPLGLDGMLTGILPGGGEAVDEFVDLNKDTTVIGADVKFLKIADMFNLQVYGYDIKTPFLVDHYSIAGIKPGIEVGGFKASAEFAMNFAGNNPFDTKYIFKPSEEDNGGINSGANLIKVDASYDIEKKAKIRASFVMQGGTEGLKEVFDGEEPNAVVVKPFLNFGNYAPGLVFGQQEITRLISMIDFQAINVGVDYTVNKFLFSLDGYNFAARDNGLNYGNEIDFKVKYQYNKALDFYLGIGCLMLSDDINSKIEERSEGDVKDFLSDMTSSFQLGIGYKF